jgi:hypothetical protein
MLDRYPQLVEVVVEFRRYMHKYIHETSQEKSKSNALLTDIVLDKPYVEHPSFSEMDIAEGYR